MHARRVCTALDTKSCISSSPSLHAVIDGYAAQHLQKKYAGS